MPGLRAILYRELWPERIDAAIAGLLVAALHLGIALLALITYIIPERQFEPWMAVKIAAGALLATGSVALALRKDWGAPLAVYSATCLAVLLVVRGDLCNSLFVAWIAWYIHGTRGSQLERPTERPTA